jgi:hypothetical protein
MNRTAKKPATAAKNRMLFVVSNKFLTKAQKRFVDICPVIPRNLVILAVDIVVTLLCTADFIAPSSIGTP